MEAGEEIGFEEVIRARERAEAWGKKGIGEWKGICEYKGIKERIGLKGVRERMEWREDEAVGT